MLNIFPKIHNAKVFHQVVVVNPAGKETPSGNLKTNPTPGARFQKM